MMICHNFHRKKSLSLPILLLLVLSLISVISVNITRVSSVESPSIVVDPPSTVDPSVSVGMLYTVSIYTDYTVEDVTSYQFTLSYNPDVLEGFEAVNGDLIVGGSARFKAGSFNETSGQLSLTVGFYFVEGDVTAGPGILANVTFRVVGKGTSDITIGPETKLIGWDDWLEPPDYNIIDASQPPGATEPPWGSDHIQHGYFDNRFSHDVAVDSVTVPPQAAVGFVVSVDVGVVNLGASDEVANVTVYYNSTYLDSKNVTLLVGQDKVVSFNWDTVGLAQGFYTINATATVSGDGDLSDNWKTATILLVEHDVAVTSILVAPDSVIPGTIIHINVTVVNMGVFEELTNVTIRYGSTLIGFNDTVTLLVGESKPFSFSWNTTGVATDIYTINATATVSGDGDLSNNWKTASVLISVHDVAIDSMTVLTPVEAGELAIFWVVTRNLGLYNETFQVKATISFGTTVIKVQTQNVTLLGDANKDVGFIWNTTGVAPASYTVKAEAILTTDEDLTNNDLTKSILIIVPPIANFTFSPSLPTVDETVTFDASLSYDPDPGGEIVSYAWNFGDGTDALYIGGNLTQTTTHIYAVAATYTVSLTVTDKDDLNATTTVDVKVAFHDISITDIKVSKDTANIGETLSINVTVKNKGSETETFNVTVYYDDIAIGTQSVTNLASDASQSLIFSWITSDVEPGTYTIKASATSLTGETNTDDNTLTYGTVTISKPATSDIFVYAAAAGVIIVVIAVVAIYFLKIRKPT